MTIIVLIYLPELGKGRLRSYMLKFFALSNAIEMYNPIIFVNMFCPWIYKYVFFLTENVKAVTGLHPASFTNCRIDADLHIVTGNDRS